MAHSLKTVTCRVKFTNRFTKRYTNHTREGYVSDRGKSAYYQRGNRINFAD